MSILIEQTRETLRNLDHDAGISLGRYRDWKRNGSHTPTVPKASLKCMDLHKRQLNVRADPDTAEAIVPLVEAVETAGKAFDRNRGADPHRVSDEGKAAIIAEVMPALERLLAAVTARLQIPG